ncbi:MAG: hypothetical protein JSS83_15035 [Cyanobacteria bacterium SZAS LIN-3]|nr:hypothetical protein [Cyanobacteria bacterium SZAS LIN-3]
MGQGQTTGDAAAAKAGDHNTATTTNTAGHDDLRAVAYTKDSATAGRDTTAAGTDKGLDRVRETTQKPAADTYTHLAKAEQAANEINQYIKGNKKDTDMVTYKGADGVEHTVKVADRIAELKKIVSSEAAIAVGQSNNIKQDQVAGLLQTARNERNTLATQAGLDTRTISREVIASALAGTTDSARRMTLEQLAQAQGKVDTYKVWENAPAYTRMRFATFKAEGLANTEGPTQRDANGALKPSQKDLVDAVQLLTEAAGNKDLRHSQLYLNTVNTVLPRLENSSAKVTTITNDLQNATNAGQAGNKVEQERLLKEAVALADSTNTAAIAQMLRDPKFVASQRNPDVLGDMAKNVVMGSTARLQYAQFLADQGKFGEAQGLILKVKTECPEVMFQADPDHPGQLLYKQSRFVDFNKLDHQVAASTTVAPGQIKNLIEQYTDAMGKGQFVTKDGVRGAHDIVADLRTAANKKVAEIADGQKGLDLAQQQLDKQKKELDSKTYLTTGARKIEEDQIAREQLMIKQQRELLAADSKEANRLLNVSKLFEASLDVSEENRDHARSLLAEVKAADPELANMPGPGGKDGFFKTLEKGAEEPSWWDRNWRKVAYGVAFAAGVVAGALTIWSGPGAALVGGGTTLGLMGAFGLTVGTAAVAGAVTGTATHYGLNKAGLVSEQVDLGKDLLQFGNAGALGGFVVGSLPLMAAAGSLGGGAAVTEVAGTAATTEVAGATTALTTEAVATQAASTVPRWLLASGRMGAVSFSGAASNELINHYATGSTWGQSAQQVGIMTALPMFGAGAGAVGKGIKGWLTGTEVAAAVENTAYVAPKLFTTSNVLWGTASVGLLEGGKGIVERQIADQMGPAYAYSRGPHTISESTSIFGPYNNTRGWDARRQDIKDGAGEGTIIQSNWLNIDPGLPVIDRIAVDRPKAPIQSTESDFTAAERLSPDEEP